jgi:hypothetical protein
LELVVAGWSILDFLLDDETDYERLTIWAVVPLCQQVDSWAETKDAAMKKVVISVGVKNDLTRQVVNGQLTVKQAAVKYGVPESLVRKWVDNAAGVAPPSSTPVTAPSRTPRPASVGSPHASGHTSSSFPSSTVLLLGLAILVIGSITAADIFLGGGDNPQTAGTNTGPAAGPVTPGALANDNEAPADEQNAVDENGPDAALDPVPPVTADDPGGSSPGGNPRVILRKIVTNAVANSEEALKASGLWEGGDADPEVKTTDTGAEAFMRKEYEDGSGSTAKYLGIKIVDYEYVSAEGLAKITFELYRHTYVDGSIGEGRFEVDLSNAYKVNWRYEVTLIYDSGSFVMDKLTWQANETDGSWKRRPVVRDLSASPSIKILLDGQVKF